VTRPAAARAPTRKEQQGAESRRRILEAASGLMGERGFAGTSISEVSRRSGLPASSIYWHFESKEGLLGAVVEEGAQRWFDELRPLERDGASGAAPFEQFGPVTAAALEKSPEFLRLLFLIALERKHIDKVSLAAIRRVRKLALVRIRKTLVTWLAEQGVAEREPLADSLSLLVLAVADGAFIQNHIDPRGADVARTFELLHRALGALGRELRSGG
jgi:AcrR family transcriptional regulator